MRRHAGGSVPPHQPGTPIGGMGIAHMAPHNAEKAADLGRFFVVCAAYCTSAGNREALRGIMLHMGCCSLFVLEAVSVYNATICGEGKIYLC